MQAAEDELQAREQRYKVRNAVLDASFTTPRRMRVCPA